MSYRWRRSIPVVGALLVLAAAAWASPRAQAGAFRMTVSGSPVGRPVAANFLGLALEFDQIPELAGATPQSVNPVFVQLMRNLDPGGRPLIRIGGLSTERTWWPLAGYREPLGLTYNLSARWMASARSLAEAINAQLMPGIELEANQWKVGQVEAAELVNGIGSQNLAALEIGNEPELYTAIPWYKKLKGKNIPWYSPAGTPVYARRPSYGPRAFMREFTRTLKAMPAHVPLAGPVTGNPAWMQAFAPYMTRRSPIRIDTWHAYGLNQCDYDPKSPQYPSVPNLLNIANSRDFISSVPPFVAQAHRAGQAFRVDELGSVTCNGHPGVSDSMASALWLTDSLFTAASDGVDGVNLHTYPGNANSLFDFRRSATGQWTATVHPIYYGAMLFAQAAPAGSRLLKLSSGSQNQVRGWATLGADHRIRVLLINDSLRRTAQSLVRAPGGTGSAAIERLGAASAYARNGVRLGGATFDPMTASGVLPAPVPQAVASRAGSYSVSLAPASAALLTLPPGRH